MKTKLFIVILFTSLIQVYTQDREAKPMQFIWGSSNTLRSLQVDSFPQNNFITGFQWTGSPKMNHALLNNSTANGGIYWENSTTYNSKRYLMNQPTYIPYDTSIKATGYEVGIWNAPAMIYEPTLYIPKGKEGQFIIRQHDSTNAIFGFQHSIGQILPDSSYLNENYNRLILRKLNDKDSVLNDVWPKPKFLTFAGGSQTGGYQGQKWNLTINLRRSNIIDDDTLDNNVILEIKLPQGAQIKTHLTPCKINTYKGFVF